MTEKARYEVREDGTVDMRIGGVYFCDYCGSDMRRIAIFPVNRRIASINGRIYVDTTCRVCKDGKKLSQ